MYKLPQNFDGQFFVGQTLEMICFNANQVYLHFGNQITLTIESAFSYRRAGEISSEKITKLPVSNTDILGLIEHSVTKSSGDAEGTLTLVFDDGAVFKCLDDSPNYESYRIKHGKAEIVV